MAGLHPAGRDLDRALGRRATLSDGTLDWPLADRAKQYAGNINATVGGITLNIDKDIVGGPLAR